MEYNLISGISYTFLTLFFVMITSSVIRNLYYNSNSFSRALRVTMLPLFVFYSSITGLGLTFIIVSRSSISVILMLITFIFSSIISLGNILGLDDKRPSVRDEWKYRSMILAKSWNEKEGKAIFQIFLKIIYIFLIICELSFAISFAIHSLIYNVHRLELILSVVTTLIFISNFIINEWLLCKYRINLISKNKKYNFLKVIILKEIESGNFTDELLEVVGMEAIKLYDELFSRSRFYCKSIKTNNEIIKEIARRCKLKIMKYSKYLT